MQRDIFCMGYQGVVKGIVVLFIAGFCSTPGFLSANTENKEIGQDQELYGYCSEKFTATDEMGFAGTYYKCLDGSISYEQPDFNIYNGRTGLCGPTAGANILQMYCNSCTTVECFDEKFVRFIKFFGLEYNLDSGTTMGSMLEAMNQGWDTFCETEKHKKFEWYLFHGGSKKEYLQLLYNSLNWEKEGFFERNVNGNLETKWPVVASIAHLGTGSHLVAVIDIETDLNLSNLTSQRGSLIRLLANHQCWVHYNTWGGQHITSCYDFATWASYPNSFELNRIRDQYKVLALVEK